MPPENILDKICATTRTTVEKRKKETPLEELKAHLKNAEKPRGFLKALQTKKEQNRPALIAEVKKASPSKGLIRGNFNPAEIAKNYENSGAACISVLTDEPYFQGHDNYLKAVKESVKLPILRKDFMIDPYQIYESRTLGADCILLIMAALTDNQAKEFYSLAKNLGMDTLIEVHNDTELHRAIELSPSIIGINNRNLKTLEVNIKTSYELLDLLPNDTIKITESGIDGPATLQSLHKAGFDGFLVGESLTRQDNIEKATQTLLGAP